MNCLTARKIVYLQEAHSAEEDRQAAWQHINACSDCQQILQQDKQLKQVLQFKLNTITTPETVRDSILSAISTVRPRPSDVPWFSWQRMGVPLVIVASSLILVLSVLLITLPSKQDARGNENVIVALAQDHLTNNLRINPLDIKGADVAELEKWFTGHLDFAVRIPQSAQAELLGGRLCTLNGNRIVYLSYRKNARPFSLYILEQNTIDLSGIESLTTGKAKRYYYGFAKGYNVILWTDKGLVYSIVSDLNEHALFELATQLQPSLTNKRS